MRHRARSARNRSTDHPSWGQRILGAILLFGTVTLVSCQSLFAALSPGLYQ